MSKLPETGRTLTGYLRDEKRQGVRQANSSSFARSGTRVSAEGETTVDGTLNVGGSLAVTGPASFSGDTTIGGNAAITGTLSLPSGIINNDALTSPVVPQSISAPVTNFALTNVSYVTLESVTITVPAGFTSAVVWVTGRVFAINPNTTGGPASNGLDYLYCIAKIEAIYGLGMPLVATGSGGSVLNIDPVSTVLTGLTPGGTFTVAVLAGTSYLPWAAQTNNTAEISGTILWFR